MGEAADWEHIEQELKETGDEALLVAEEQRRAAMAKAGNVQKDCPFTIGDGLAPGEGGQQERHVRGDLHTRRPSAVRGSQEGHDARARPTFLQRASLFF